MNFFRSHPFLNRKNPLNKCIRQVGVVCYVGKFRDRRQLHFWSWSKSPSAEILICHDLWSWKIHFEKWSCHNGSGSNNKTFLEHLDKKLFRNAKCLIDTSIFEDFIWMVYLQWAKTIHIWSETCVLTPFTLAGQKI